MKFSREKYRLACLSLVLTGLMASLPVKVEAQGNIFGEVHNADMSVPPDNSVLFIGFTADTDNELRIQSCIGAGYEAGHWLDDFQNYLVATTGLEYRYYFFNLFNIETATLISTIPSNSFQQEDVVLAPGDFPAAAESFTATVIDGPQVQLDWFAKPDRTYHIYRRASSSRGSFFRLDNPAGDRSDRGVAGASYIDTEVTIDAGYQYILVTESTPGNYSPASEIAEVVVDLTSCCQGKVGDVNGIGGDTPSIGDVALLIDYLFISGTMPECLAETDVNQSGGPNPTPKDISIGDVALLIDHLFISAIPLPDCF